MASDAPLSGSDVDASGVRPSSDPRARRDETPPSMPSSPPCTFCGGEETEIMSSFGSHASVSTYWCRSCRSPFEMMKWRER